MADSAPNRRWLILAVLVAAVAIIVIVQQRSGPVVQPAATKTADGRRTIMVVCQVLEAAPGAEADPAVTDVLGDLGSREPRLLDSALLDPAIQNLVAAGTLIRRSMPQVILLSGDRAEIEVAQSSQTAPERIELTFSFAATATQGDAVALEARFKVRKIEGEIEAALDELGLPVGSTARAAASYDVPTGASVVAARPLGNSWYIVIVKPMLRPGG